jgi:hypothetical protein
MTESSDYFTFSESSDTSQEGGNETKLILLLILCICCCISICICSSSIRI